MRQYSNLLDAAREIRRDLTRALPHESQGVQQNRDLEVISREALNYTYSLPIYAVLTADFHEILDVVLPHEANAEMADRWLRWMTAEIAARANPLNSFLHEKARRVHPLREQFLEGFEPSYSYPHRILQAGTLTGIASLLDQDPYTRRVYLPIYQPLDTLRSELETRVPCSLGYHFMVREVNGSPHLHMTYYMRACDFSTFWLSDLILAAQMAKEVQDLMMEPVELGNIVHDIASFHILEGVHGEIY